MRYIRCVVEVSSFFNVKLEIIIILMILIIIIILIKITQNKNDERLFWVFFEN